MTARRIVTVAAALLLALLIMMNAAVGMLAPRDPAAAARIWARHPQVEISSAMTQIALAAREGRNAPAAVFPALARAAVQDPLAVEPFLVRGVQLSLAGNAAGAESAFAAGQWRDPRSLPATYFLADHYVRAGKIAPALRQIAVLARLSPGGGKTAAPYLAAFASDPANWPALRTTLSANPTLAAPTFDVLSGNMRTVPALLALVDAKAVTPKSSWFPRLIETLIEAGQYAKAKSLWARGSQVPGTELLYDSRFTDKTSPPPFNWALTANAVGLAERQPGGRLHVLYYGDQDGILAAQLLTLPPGTYRLQYDVISGKSVRDAGLTWSIWCQKASEALASVTLSQGDERGLTFVVPQNCPAQSLRMSGSSGDVARQSDVTIGHLRLTGGRGA